MVLVVLILMELLMETNYIVIRHRNHLSVMSADKVTLPNSTLTLYDFTSGDGSQFYSGNGSGAKELENNVWGMIAADGNGNGQIQNND